MKKTAAKSAVKPASPAPKAAVAAAKPAVKVTAAKKAAKPAPAPVAAPVVVATKAPKAAKKTAAPKAKPAVVTASTDIVAAIDVGFGNSLTLRGEGAGLSWEKGIPLAYTADNKWSVSLPATGPVTFKFLVNDLTWSAGDDYSAPAGASVELTPAF